MNNLADHPIGAVVPWQDGEETVMLEVAQEVEDGECTGCYLLPYDCLQISCGPASIIFTLHNTKGTE